MKILIIRFSSIGDIVLTTPVLRCIKQQIKECEIHYLTFNKYSAILEANPNINKLLTVDQEPSEIKSELTSENYDYVIDLHKNIRTSRVKGWIKGARVLSYDKLNWEKWLLVNFKIDNLPNLHIVDRYLETIKELEVVNDHQGLDYYIPDDQIVDLNSLPEPFQQGYICIAIGAQHFTKQIPASLIITICDKINQPVILLGGKEDFEKAEEIVSGSSATIFNACGPFTVNQSASLINQSKGVISGDTGMMHIAAALKKPLVSVWGNTVPKFGMYPLFPPEKSNHSVIVENKLPCRPCSKLGHSKCPKGHFKCMELHSGKGIAEKLISLQKELSTQ